MISAMEGITLLAQQAAMATLPDEAAIASGIPSEARQCQSNQNWLLQEYYVGKHESHPW